MAYGEYGGNGSVHWLIDADDVDEIAEKTRMFGSDRKPGRREWRQHGVDYYGKKEIAGTDFTIRVKVPAEHRKAWIAQVRRQLAAAARGEILEFTLPIEKSDDPHAQIQICWGKTPTWQDNLYLLSTELHGKPDEN
jgi:hypothetical protein